MFKSGRGSAAFLLVLFILITFTHIAAAGEQTLFDKNMTIGDWYVHASQHSFSAEDGHQARVKITKRTPDMEIQRGFFVLNGAFTFLRDFLAGDEPVFEKDVALSADNSLIVVLLGEPDAQIGFQVIADDSPLPGPKISAFTAEPLFVKRGESATLTWQTANADSCSIEPDIGPVDPNGSQAVTPADTTTYTLTAEGSGEPATAAVTVTIGNSPPVADPQSVSTDEDVPLAITLSASDADGDSLTYSIGVQPAGGTLSGTPPDLTYTPDADFNGPDAFSFTASDGDATSQAATVGITVKPVNDAPLANDDEASTSEDTPVVIANLLANDTDVDNDALTITGFTQPANGELTQLSGDSFEYTPDLNFYSQDSFSYTIADGNGGTASATVRMVVISINDAPVAEDQTVDLSEDQAVGITLDASDAEGDSLTYEIVAQPAEGALSGDAPNLTYTPNLNYSGEDAFSYKAGDGQAVSNTATITLNIAPVNDAPVADAGEDQDVFVGDAVFLDGSGSTDVETETLTFNWSLSSIPQGSTAALSDSSTESPTFVPDLAGGYTVELIVSDGEVDSLADPVLITATIRMVDVPDVVGLPQAEAEAAILNAGLIVGTITNDSSETVPEGAVIGQGPEAGVSVEENSAVDLIISMGSAAQPPAVSFSAAPSSIEQGQTSTLSWSSLRADAAHIDHGVGAVAPDGSTVASPEHTTTYTITVTGPTGSANAKVTVQVIASPEPQPEGSYGAQYEDLVPADATVGQYDPKRFSLITGRVNGVDQQPLPGVTITVHRHPEYGSVLTDEQGRFSIPVEGGGTLTVVYEKQGFISVQRKVVAPWNDNAVADTIVMISEDPAATTVTFDGDAESVLTHKSEDIVDEAGTRAVTMVFSGDNKAYLVDEAGDDVQQLTTITTRATEYRTPEAMPAKLPPNSAFTYCAELKVDGVERVRFDKPVTTFIDNFLGFPVGSIVPVGYYDRDKGAWVPSENGVVVRLLDSDNDGEVDALDADGDGLADDLNKDGSISDEVKGLNDGQRYLPDSTYWRAAIKHFTPCDLNWPVGPPPGAVPPNAGGITVVDQQDFNPFSAGEQSRKDIQCVSSFVEQRSRVFHEDIPIPGTDMTLHYTSSRVAGYKPGVISVPASGDTVPQDLLKIIVQVNVAGKNFSLELPPEPNQIVTFEWDGLDYLEKPVTGTVVAHVKIGFVYPGFYYVPSTVGPAFGQPGQEASTIPSREETTLWQFASIPIARSKGVIAEGWTLSEHHQLSPLNPGVLFKGDGSVSKNTVRIIDTIAGTGISGYSGDGGPSNEAQVGYVTMLETDAAGNLYICDYVNDRVRMVGPDGLMTSVPAWINPHDVAVDPAGNLYIVNHLGHDIVRRNTDGSADKIAGIGKIGYGGDGGPAVDAHLYHPTAVTLDASGNVYIADTYNQRIRKVDTSGIITTVAGNGTRGYSGDGGPATQAQITYPRDIVIDASGNLFIADDKYIRKVDTSGIISTIAGDGGWENFDDGIPATQASLDSPNGLAMDTAGNLYLVEIWNNHRVRKIDTLGIITTIAGGSIDLAGAEGFGGDGGPAVEALFDHPTSVAVDPAGNIYISDWKNYRIRKISTPSAQLAGAMDVSDFAFTEQSGVGFILTAAGLHKKTIDLQAGVPLYEFDYDSENRLLAIIDQFGNTMNIERDVTTGVPTAIISPDGIRTELSIDARNHLDRVTYEDGSFYDFEYTAEGLMLAETEPAGNRFEHAFDEKGRLTDVLDGEGGHWTYGRMVNLKGEILTEVLSGEGNLTTFLDHTDSTGKYKSTITEPSGAMTYFLQSDDGLTENHSLACGTDLEYTYDLDPEYKYKYVKQSIESTPAGLTKITTIDKTYTDTDEDEMADLIVETVTVNDKAASIENNTLAAQKKVVSPEGRMLTSLYDPTTLQVENISVAGLHPTIYSYDARGRPASVTTGTRQSSFAYTADGFLESVTDPEDRTTSYAYDPIGRVTGINRPDGNFVDFSYDANGNMTVLVNPAGTEHKFGFNRVNRNSSYTTPLSGSYSYVYDKDRRLIRTNFPSGRQISNIYEDGRLVQMQTPEGTIDFSYGCGTKIGSIMKGAESITYGYDGKLITSETIGGTLGQSLSYNYNNDFDVTAFSYAGSTVNYAYDNDGLLTAAGSFVIARNADNGLPESATGGALSLTRTFNGYAEVAGQGTSVGGSTVTSWALTRNNNGRITQKTETVAGAAANYSYAYDPVGRLLTVVKDGTLVEEYRYDPNGTRNYEYSALRGITGRSFTYSEEDHLLVAGTTTYQYDPDGFLTTRTVGADVTSYAYSMRGELLNVTLPDNSLIEYVHDPLGRRIAKKVNGAITEKYLWQGLTRLLAVYDGSDNLLMRFEYADDRMPMAVTTEGVTYYLAYDQVGSLRLVADSTGAVVKRIDYDSFGNIIADSDPAFYMPFGFAGGLHDRDTRLVRFGYRDYDPDVGRWTAKDPIFFAGGDTDLYGYVLNDPVNLVDPLGLESILPGSGFPDYKPTNIDRGKLITGALMTSDGIAMSGTWLAATFGTGSVHPGFGVYFGIVTAPALFGGIFEMYHGLHTMFEAFDFPFYNFKEINKKTPCP